MQSFFFKKCLFEYENPIAFEKKEHTKIFGGRLKNTRRRHQ